jgi:hypothetical protein
MKYLFDLRDGTYMCTVTGNKLILSNGKSFNLPEYVKNINIKCRLDVKNGLGWITRVDNLILPS